MIAARKQTASSTPAKNEFKGERASIAVDKLVESVFNARKTYDEKKIDELAESMKSIGQLQSILVRPSPSTPGFFEVAAGHRRRRAAEKAGIADLDAVIRKLTDEEMIIVSLTENGDRDNLPPLEEAAGYAQLRERGWTIERIADETGKSESHVQRRLKLVDLAPEVREAVAAGWLPASGAASIARLDSVVDQAEVIRKLAKNNGGPTSEYFRRPTEGDITYEIEQVLRALKDAPFDPGDAKLFPAAGTCAKCPKRTLAQPELFADIAERDRVDGFEADDRCLDGDCWRQKVHAHGLVQIGKAKATGTKVLTPDEARAAGVFDEYGYVQKKNFVRLDGYANGYGGTDQKKWRDVVKNKLEPIIVIDSDGEPVKVVPTKEAKKLLPKPVKVRGGDLKTSEKSEAQKAREKLEQDLEDAKRAAIVRAFYNRGVQSQDAALWRHFASRAADMFYDAGDLAELLGVKGNLEQLVKNAKTSGEFAGLALAADVADSDYHAEKYAKALGIDLKAVIKKAEEGVRLQHEQKHVDKEVAKIKSASTKASKKKR
jgi:ParB/RepB/Spo0J family partition protein